MADSNNSQGSGGLVWILVLLAVGAVGYWGWQSMSHKTAATPTNAVQQAPPSDPAPAPQPPPAEQPAPAAHGERLNM
jgi:hypothetical protein